MTTMGGIFQDVQDPAMKEMIKSQQKAVMGPMMTNVSAFFQQLNLTPEQTAVDEGFAAEKNVAGAEVGMSMIDGSMDAAQRADLVKQIKSRK